MDESAPGLPNPTITTRDVPAPTLPPPTPAPGVAAPTLPAAPVFAAAPTPPPPGPGGPNAVLTPISESTSTSKRPLMVALTLITVLAAGIGAFIVSRSNPDDAPDDATPQLVSDAETATDTAFSFAAAATNARTAGSMRLEMTADSPEGDVSMVATIDRASQRISLDADLSQLSTDESFFETPDSVSMILDESTSTMYLGSEFYGFLGGVGTPWISASVDDMDDGGDSIDEIFANPFEMDFLFGDVEPVDLGLETIEGEELRHFQIPVSLSDALAGGEGDVDGLVDLRDIEGIEALDEVVYDVWVSEDNTIRRIGLDLVVADQANGFDMWIEVSPDSVEIPLPEPSEVTDIQELFGSWNAELENSASTPDDGSVILGED